MKRWTPEFKNFVGMIFDLHGRENGKTVKEMAEIIFGEVNRKTRQKIHNYLFIVRNDKSGFGTSIPVWGHKIPRKREKLYCISKSWSDFNDVKTDLFRRYELTLWHALTHKKRASQLGIDIDVIPRFKRVKKKEEEK